jgi:signal transduction histidine kinase
MEVIEHHRRDAGPGGPRALRHRLRVLGQPAVVLCAVLASCLAHLLDWVLDWRPMHGATLAADGLLAGLLWLMLQQRDQAERSAVQQGSDVQARTAWLEGVSSLSPDAVLVFERDAAGDLRLVFTNPAFSELFGLRPQELLGLSEGAADEWLAWLARDDRPMPPLQAGEATLELAGPPRRVLRRRSREDGRQRVYYFRDITHESEVERLKNEFLTTAAHELRTPLVSVYGFSELMASPMAEARRLPAMAQTVHQHAAVLKRLVDQLLDLARLDAHGAADFRLQPQELGALLQHTVDALAEPRLVLERPAVACWVRADPAKLQQALGNALSNGLKYSQTPAPVRLRLHTAPREGQDWVWITVEDQGIGMDEAQRARAFERFYRADPSGHRLGAGLGLPIVQAVVHHHHGRLELHSVPGQGTRLEIGLPSCPAPDALTS